MSISANQVLALNYQDTIRDQTLNTQVAKSQISAAKLLQDYVISYTSKINALHVSYNGTKSIIISNFNFQTSNMYAVLEDVQKGKYSEKMSSKILSNIVDELKIINTKMRVFLKQEKTLYIQSIKEKQILLAKICTNISWVLDTLLFSISNQLIEKNNLSQRDKQVVESLVVLREYNNKMKQFKKLNFETHEEMNSYIKNIVELIRWEFIKMKQL